MVYPGCREHRRSYSSSTWRPGVCIDTPPAATGRMGQEVLQVSLGSHRSVVDVAIHHRHQNGQVRQIADRHCGGILLEHRQVSPVAEGDLT